MLVFIFAKYEYAFSQKWDAIIKKKIGSLVKKSSSSENELMAKLF